MKDWVVNLTVVLADGQVIKTRHRPRKTSAGYNLTSLFVGAEGTLGFVTEITVKLAVVPQDTSVAIVSFPTIEEAAKAATGIIRSGLQLAALELMDEVQMSVLNKHGSDAVRKRTWDESPTLFLKSTYLFFGMNSKKLIEALGSQERLPGFRVTSRVLRRSPSLSMLASSFLPSPSRRR